MATAAGTSPALKFSDAPDADFPFLTVYKNGVLVECMCLHGLESIVLGRHTNCDLMVTHPSVSRHHLEIQVLHGSRELLLTDLDSIHGTRINGEQALPLVPVTAKEGDSFKLGASSRIYSVQWRPRPPQNSTSSENYSDNSDSQYMDCSKCKEQITAGSTTTLESSKPSQVNSGNNLQGTTCSTKCSDAYAVDENSLEQSVLPESRIAANSGDSNKGASILNDEKLNLEPELLEMTKTAAETLPKDGNAEVSRDLHENWEGSKETVFCQMACVMPSNSQIGLQYSTEKDEVVMQADTKQHEEKSRNIQAMFTVCEGQGNEDVQAEKSLEDANPALSKLWVRRSKSNPPPNLLTSMDSTCSTVALPLKEKKNNCPIPSAPPMPLSYLVNNLVPSAPPLLPPNKLVMLNEGKVEDGQCISDDFACDDSKENNICSVRYHQGISCNITQQDPVRKYVEVSDEYISDKENDSPGLGHGCKQLYPIKDRTYDRAASQERSQSATSEPSRRPFQPLALTADGGCKPLSPACSNDLFEEENSIGKIKKRPSPLVQNLDLMLRKLKGTARSEPRRAWHIVVDVSCFLDSNSFKSLRQLEGIREVRLIIPKIVISELDFRRGMGGSQRKALNWIESCMVKLPSWIHVQSSSENLPVAMTPPVSPLSAPSLYGGNYESMVSPTNGDHVLNCALLFSNTVFSGQVALLTNDLALKIKAMAEGLICEAPSPFCESLLSPYSGRFLWATSIAHGHGWTEKPFHIKGSSALAPSVLCGNRSPKEAVMSTVKAMAFSRKNQGMEGLKKQCCKQAQGLKVALADRVT